MAGVTLLPIFIAFLASTYISGLTKSPLPSPAWERAVEINESYIPQPAAPEGIFAPNTKLQAAVKLFKGRINGSESVVVGADGSLYLPDRYGSILRATSAGEGQVHHLQGEAVAFLGGGRPLGAAFDAAGNLIVCLPPLGLVMVEKDTNRVVVLTSKVDGGDPQKHRSARINYPDDLVIHPETGDIYFSDSADVAASVGKDGYYDLMWAFKMVFFQGKPSGRILKYSPSARTTTIVADGFWFPNGVALSADHSFLVVAETPSMRLRRVYLSGSQAGQVDVFMDRLPGFPDGVCSAPGGSFWVSIVSPPQAPMQWLIPRRRLRALVAHLSTLWQAPLKPSGRLVKVSEAGVAEEYLEDPEGKHISGITAVVQAENRLYMGFLDHDYVAYYDLPPASSTA
mmetsp:Transcript_1980/g.5885  ORF Transcript_1980/g.5885 Transcript_1980/m.5885 type:complete len:398 (+) Transcript_1980:214-1407(+)